MKQISIALNVIFIVYFLYTFYEKYIAPQPYSSCITCDGSFQGIPANKFVEDIARYKTTHWNLVNQDAHVKGLWNTINNVRVGTPISTEFQDSRCIWFSLDTIKKFLCNIEKYSAPLNIPKDSLGIRIYYAVYDTSDNKGRHSQHTLFMVPTTQDDNETKDFDHSLSFRYKKEVDNKIIYLPSFIDSLQLDSLKFYPNIMANSSKNSNDTIYNGNQQLMILGTSTSQNSKSKFAQNNGNLCPTNCPKVNTLTEIDKSLPSVGY